MGLNEILGQTTDEIMEKLRRRKKNYKWSFGFGLLPKSTKVDLSGMVKNDMTRFVEEILTSEYVASDVDVHRLHNVLKEIYLQD